MHSSPTIPKARVGLIAKVQQEAARLGRCLAAVVMRQLAPGAQPVGARDRRGADPAAMTRLLNLDPKENPAALLSGAERDQGRATVRTNLKHRDGAAARTPWSVASAIAISPITTTMANKLAALYRGATARTPRLPLTDAFNDLIGKRL